ncbi:hypothetical protein [Methanolacinia petrolearia]|uniref:hypothetical protein n=1 Tax=Methanolacinia petrolearia TaxID=54120 RepID=UPI003BAA7011
MFDWILFIKVLAQILQIIADNFSGVIGQSFSIFLSPVLFIVSNQDDPVVTRNLNCLWRLNILTDFYAG